MKQIGLWNYQKRWYTIGSNTLVDGNGTTHSFEFVEGIDPRNKPIMVRLYEGTYELRDDWVPSKDCASRNGSFPSSEADVGADIVVHCESALYNILFIPKNDVWFVGAGPDKTIVRGTVSVGSIWME